jgi:hypothetical protein
LNREWRQIETANEHEWTRRKLNVGANGPIGFSTRRCRK